MKFSELLKDHDIVVPLSSKRPVERPESEPPKGKDKEIDVFEIENKIRGQLEEEYRHKVSFIQEETKKLLEQMTREQESRFQDREKQMTEERQELTRLRDELKYQQELLLQSTKADMETALAKQMEEEKRKAVLEAQKAIEEIQKKSAEEKARFLEKERFFEQKLAEKASPVNELSVSNETPGFGFAKPMDSSRGEVPAGETIFDDSHEVSAKRMYGRMVHEGTGIFSQFSKSENPDMDSLSKLISELIEQLPEIDSYLMGLSLESYADGNPFIYHAVNVTVFSLVLGQEFNFSDEKMRELGVAAFLHDVGLVNMIEDLGYPKDLSSQIKKEVLEHPAKGAEMLKAWLSPDALAGIKQHHEVGNGKGYPAKLQAAQIHIYANIIHVADCFEALTHPRPYRKRPFDVNDAVKEIIDTGRGIYNRDVLKALMSRVGLYPVMTYVELSNKQVAKVIRQNKQLPVSPTVQIEYDEEGRKLVHPKVVDLSQTQFFHIVGPAKRYNLSTGHSSSQFSSPKSKASSSHRLEMSKDIISLVLVGLVLLILLYVVVKI